MTERKLNSYSRSEVRVMLERVLEPEVMETDSEALDYDEMDHAAVNQAFVADLIAFLGVEPSENFSDEERLDVIDLGTGTARIPILLAEQLPQCRIMALDASPAMLDIAKINIDIAMMTERVQLTHMDGKQIDFEDDYFHVVMSNSIVHHIPQPMQVLSEAVRITLPGGHIFVRDLKRPNSEAELQHLVETHTANENESSRKMFAESLRAALTLEEIQALVGQLGFAPETVTETSDRHWTWQVTKPAS